MYSVIEQFSGDTAGSRSDDGKTGSSDAQRVFNVVSLNGSGSSVGAKLAPGIPRIGFAHPDNFYLRCRSVDCNRRSPIMYEVTANYFADTQDPENSPLNEPPKITFSTITSDEEIDEDIDGNPLVTVNGEPYEGITMSVEDLSMTITRNLPTFNPTSIYTYVNKVNSAQFFNFPAGTVRCVDINASQATAEQNFEYWVASVTFQMREPLRVPPQKAWWKRVLHQGYIVKDRDGNPVTASTINGQDVTKPILLKDDGTPETDPEQGTWRTFQIYGTADFNQMNLL